ncbi:MAG: DUF5666 domain-containing protein [Anaerolineae bacterium]
MKFSRAVLAVLALLMLFGAGAMVVSADPPTPEAAKPQVQPADPNQNGDQSEYQPVTPNDTPPAPTATLSITVKSSSGGAQSTFNIGELQQICYTVPSAGYIRIISTTPNYPPRLVIQGWDNGTGGCFLATVGAPAGQRTLTIQTLDYWGNVTGTANTTFTVNPPAPQANVVVRGTVTAVAANQFTVHVTTLVAGWPIPGGSYTIVTGGTPGTCTTINNGPIQQGSYVEIKGNYSSGGIIVCGVPGSYVTVFPNVTNTSQVYVNRGCGSAYGVGAPIYIYMQITQPGQYSLTNQGPNTGNNELVMWQGYLTPGLWVIVGQVGLPTGNRTLRLRTGLGTGGTVLSTCGYSSQTGIAATPQGKAPADADEAPSATSGKSEANKRPNAKPLEAKGQTW